MASNYSKPYQAGLIQAAGFRVPETLVTTDPEAVVEFWRRHATVIYKSMSSSRSVVGRLTGKHLDRLQAVTTCPTQFQRWVPGIDHRVHVVGDAVFCSQIRATGDDYRYPSTPDGQATIRPVPLPDDLAARCRRLADTLHLPLAGIDLRLSDDGDWYCFEVNPAPDFTYYDDQDQTMAQTVAKLLADRSIAPSGGGQNPRPNLSTRRSQPSEQASITGHPARNSRPARARPCTSSVPRSARRSDGGGPQPAAAEG